MTGLRCHSATLRRSAPLRLPDGTIRCEYRGNIPHSPSDALGQSREDGTTHFFGGAPLSVSLLVCLRCGEMGTRGNLTSDTLEIGLDGEGNHGQPWTG